MSTFFMSTHFYIIVKIYKIYILKWILKYRETNTIYCKLIFAFYILKLEKKTNKVEERMNNNNIKQKIKTFLYSKKEEEDNLRNKM